VWVLSQDRTTLMDVKFFRIWEMPVTKQIVISVATRAGKGTFMGKYESEEAAKAVLKDIAACIGKGVQIFKMP
jgi:hypothetical protein